MKHLNRRPMEVLELPSLSFWEQVGQISVRNSLDVLDPASGVALTDLSRFHPGLHFCDFIITNTWASHSILSLHASSQVSPPALGLASDSVPSIRHVSWLRCLTVILFHLAWVPEELLRCKVGGVLLPFAIFCDLLLKIRWWMWH